MGTVSVRLMFTLLFCLSAVPVASSGLLFHLSADVPGDGYMADTAVGDPEPTVMEHVEIVSGGPHGAFFSCPDNQLVAYQAPGNIHAQRGTLGFFWRSRYPMGKIPFPIFRVSYADHSSWDFEWLRIDYNGHGFDAFVTDANLARTRVSYRIPEIPSAEQWTHIAFSWDENRGVRLSINGVEVAARDTVTVYDAGLDQIGTHSRIISPYNVQSSFYSRGGDVDEIAIFDRMLDQGDISRLARGENPSRIDLPPLTRSLDNPEYRDEWMLRYGWNRPGDLPPYLASPTTVVRKVEVHDAYDLKQRWFKGCDGIRETTWPSVYNRSSLPGRTDYFVLPDWNCYTISGRQISFHLPDEPWNHMEITGAAAGPLVWQAFDKESAKPVEQSLMHRPAGQERTVNRFDTVRSGGIVRFTNDVPETPIGECQFYNVLPGTVPGGRVTLSYGLVGGLEPDYPCLERLNEFIAGRYPPDERATMVALTSDAPRTEAVTQPEPSLPLVHVLVPFGFRDGSYHRRISGKMSYSYTWENINGGLDGIAIDLPALDVMPTHDGYLPLNIRVMDPIWPARVLADFSCSVKPGEPRTIWLDTRDRLLPNDESLYLTIAAAGGGFSPESLAGARIRLVFKDRETAIEEHAADRFVQARDNAAHFIEERPNNRAFRLYDRFAEDMTDLFRADPGHKLGRAYWSWWNSEQGWEPVEQPVPPAGVPLWAFRQIECLKGLSDIVLWWIDNRMIENGELGGGLSDDSDFTNVFPWVALMGIQPEKVTDLLQRAMDTYYDNGMFTNGLNTILTDALHTTEEGVIVQAQLMMVDYGNPTLVERMMETAGAYEKVTGFNSAGHRHFRSNFFSATIIPEEDPWQWSEPRAFRGLAPLVHLTHFNGSPRTKKFLTEIADGLVAHRKQDENGRWYTTATVYFPTDEDQPASISGIANILWGVWYWTGDDKYLLPITDMGWGGMSRINPNMLDILGKRKALVSEIAASGGRGFSRHLTWQATGNTQYLEEYYGDLIEEISRTYYINTEGHLWSDRVRVSTAEIQRARLGGVAKSGKAGVYPGHTVSWAFDAPSSAEDVALLIPDATETSFTVTAYNLSTGPVTTTMTGWNVEPGTWELVEGPDSDGDGAIDGKGTRRRIAFGRSESVELTFPARAQTVVTMRRVKKATPYSRRPDLGIGARDIRLSGRRVTATVHSIGSVPAPEATLAIVDGAGTIIAEAAIPALDPPLDYIPRTTDLVLSVPGSIDPADCSVVIDPGQSILEVTRMNNTVRIVPR
jgi:hypothetical protein